MKNLSRTSWLAAAVLAVGFTQPVGAVDDTYWGGDPTGTLADQDVIGSDTFEIHSMSGSLTGSTLTVSIDTNFAGQVDTADALNAVYGDLFLSSSWTPVGTGPEYTADNALATNTTNWTYGFNLDDRTSNTGGDGDLYALTGSNDDSAILSDNFFTSGYRAGQEVAVDTAETTYVTDVNNTAGNFDEGTWSISSSTKDGSGYSSSGLITFVIDLTGTNLLNGGAIAVHWAMSCANDVIEGYVPAPIILLLMATGLFGVGVSTAARRKRA